MDISNLIQTVLIYALPVIFAITVHEAAHGYVARHFGDNTAEVMGRVTLNPMKHIDPIGTILMPLMLYFATSGAFLFGYAKPVPVNFGRLRHPNVVDVTDFVFARVKAGQVAYLVMEYLDGCTLGDVLAEEKRLPLEWVADILDQVCSAVHEAHQHGIIHRDLKPDNIWLEPNRLGSYRVKVLDFGIAKLGEAGAPPADDDPALTIIDDVAAAAALENDTLMRPGGEEASTQHFKAKGEAVSTVIQDPLTNPLLDHTDHADDDGTLLFDQKTYSGGRHTAHIATSPQGAALTRVGAIMGTPLYMSPEQCGGGHVDTRSDIYSLGVIAYQMLAGEPPFAGNTSTVMRSHREQKPQQLREGLSQGIWQ